MKLSNRHYGDYSDKELKSMSTDQLIAIIMEVQNDDNFIIMSDSYKMTHHLLYPDFLRRVSSYMEPRGGDMPYTVFSMLQYYIKRYIAGRRITPEKIEDARQANIAHFGFDCFDSTMWDYICKKHDGNLPLKINAIPEGTPIAVKNVIMTIENTDFEHCAPLTNITETLLMKLWATNTVAAYNRIIKELIIRYHAITSDAPAFLIDYMHHDFGYRGTSSEETARLMSAAAMISFKGTDTMGGLSFIKKYYHLPGTSWMEAMAGYSVIASEHSVMCAYGGRGKEEEAYLKIIKKIKNNKKILNAKPASGVIIVSLVSDTYNIFNVPFILKRIENEFIGWTNNHGIPIKIVIRPDSGDAKEVLFGKDGNTSKEAAQKRIALSFKVAKDMGIEQEKALELVEKGLFRILFDLFGYTTNSKGYKVLHPQIGVLQGDGVSYKVIDEIYQIMIKPEVKIDIMCLVFGSGGKNLQAHDRDEQKYAIKATSVTIEETKIAIEKNPITDEGKKSKKGELKLVRKQITDDISKDWMNFVTLQEGDEGYEEAVSLLDTVFLNGKLIKEFDYNELRANSEIKTLQLVA